jgi:hypothetical protein
MTHRILLIDLAERELAVRAKLSSRRDQLKAIELTSNTSGGLSSAQAQEVLALNSKLDSDTTVDTFFQTVASQLTQRSWEDITSGPREQRTHGLEYGLLPSQLRREPAKELTSIERECVAVCGLMQLDNITDPTHSRFIRSISQAQGEYRQNVALFDRAFMQFSQQFSATLQSQIDKQSVSASVVGCIEPGQSIAARPRAGNNDAIPALSDTISALSGRTVAAVVRRLSLDRVSANDPWLASRLESAFNLSTGVTEGAPPSALEIMLPDLEESVDIDIVKENLNALQAIYFAYQLEEMRMFQVMERIVELFRQGLLPLGRGKVGDYLFNYYKKAAERITEGERRDLYFRAFGVPGGNPQGSEPNRDFNELWLRFVSAVSSFSRQLTVERMLRSAVPMAISQEQVRKAGRDLGANLSRNGYGIAYFAATELQQSILEFRDILSDAELRNAFGARDMWQVIEVVNANYLGGSRNTHRYRTQSRAGAIVIRWIANNVQRLSNMSGPVVGIEQIINPQLRELNPNRNPTTEPSDWDLVNACEQWLAVGGVQEQSVEQYAQPIESPITATRPIGMPQMARDALDAVGINLPA